MQRVPRIACLSGPRQRQEGSGWAARVLCLRHPDRQVIAATRERRLSDVPDHFAYRGHRVPREGRSRLLRCLADLPADRFDELLEAVRVVAGAADIEPDPPIAGGEPCEVNPAIGVGYRHEHRAGDRDGKGQIPRDAKRSSARRRSTPPAPGPMARIQPA